MTIVAIATSTATNGTMIGIERIGMNGMRTRSVLTATGSKRGARNSTIGRRRSRENSGSIGNGAMNTQTQCSGWKYIRADIRHSHLEFLGRSYFFQEDCGNRSRESQ